MRQTEELVAALGAAFRAESSQRPSMTLRSGDSVDSYGTAQPFDDALDVVSDEYLERFSWGLSHLDVASWKHYLPALGALALRRKAEGGMAGLALISSLRPPDREPPRLGSLSREQEQVVRELLEVLAFAADSAWQAEACQALEEWWIDDPLYRTP